MSDCNNENFIKTRLDLKPPNHLDISALTTTHKGWPPPPSPPPLPLTHPPTIFLWPTKKYILRPPPPKPSTFPASLTINPDRRRSHSTVRFFFTNPFFQQPPQQCSELSLLFIKGQPLKISKIATTSPSNSYRIMALRGVWQLQKLVVSYCDWGGSSRGIRAFMETNLPTFKEKNPQLEVIEEHIRGQHPHLKAYYKNHNQRVVCVKNMTPEDILLHATRLRNALGRKVIKLRTRHVTNHPSVQGTWTTAVRF